jgi:serine/threonine-protein kinase
MVVDPDDTRLGYMLVRWEELRDQGQDIPIEELCADDPELIEELKRRIAVLQAMDPLRSGTGAMSTRPFPLARSEEESSQTRRSAACTANYRDLRFHAAGGLGEVFRAWGDDLHRDVALKFLKKRVAHEPDSQRRFLQEAEVTGRLEHPGIVPVYSLGRDEEGQPCYAMRFVRGQTLDEAIQQYHAERTTTAGRAERNHALRGLIKRLVSVCNTIAYAHSRGMLHRDIKPKNIMLGKYDETLVVDWGLARSFERSELERQSGEETLRPSSGDSASGTRTGGIVGTPAYMSPEQTLGHSDQVGPESDVYSLGATLYNLLTGRPAAAGRNLGELIERVRRGEFPPPRQVNRTVPRALNAICLKAMALRIEDRYATALDLADDLERWLADEPVTAYREPVLARLARWGRRHKTAVASITVLLVTAVLAMALATVLLGRQNEEIQRQKKRVDEEYFRAENNFRLAGNAVDRMLTEVGAVELADVPQMEPIRARLLDEASRFYEEFLKQKESGPAVRLEAARAHRHLADIREMLGDYVVAEQSYREAIILSEKLVAESPTFRPELARAETGLGILLKKSNRYQEAEQVLRAAFTLWDQLAAGSHDPDVKRADADSRYQWATLLARLPGKRSESEETYSEAIKLQEDLIAAADPKSELHRDHARSLNNLGILLAGNGRLPEAEDRLGDALKIQETLVQEAPDVPGHRWLLARIVNNLGQLVAPTRPGEALTYYEKALRLQMALKADFPRIPSYPLELAKTLNNLGMLHQQREAPEEAERAFRQALKPLEELESFFPNMPDYRFEVALTQSHLAPLLERRAPQEAEQLYASAHDRQDRLVREFPGVPEYQSALGRTLYNHAIMMATGPTPDRPKARRLVEEAVQHQQNALRSNPQNPLYRNHLRDSFGILTATLILLGNHPEAARTAEELPRIMPGAAYEYLRAARFLTQCMNRAVDRRTKSDYADRAIIQLKRAVDRRLLQDPAALNPRDFDELRDRDDFKALLQLLKNLAQPGVG